MTSPTPLFLVGVGRSGTTALTEVVSAHPQIVLGMERFKGLWGQRIAEIDEDLLTRERFFDFSDGLTNVRPDIHERWARFYGRQEARWDAARYVGDKMTVARMDPIWQRLPEARFVCIVRAPEEVAASWDVRAQRADDVNWPEKLNAERAISAWNSNNRRIRRAARQHPERAVVVEYSAFFGDPQATSLRAVLRWLGLDHTEEVAQAFATASTTYLDRIVDKPRDLSPEGLRFVNEHVDAGLWGHLVKLAL